VLIDNLYFSLFFQLVRIIGKSRADFKEKIAQAAVWFLDNGKNKDCHYQCNVEECHEKNRKSHNPCLSYLSDSSGNSLRLFSAHFFYAVA